MTLYNAQGQPLSSQDLLAIMAMGQGEDSGAPRLYTTPEGAAGDENFINPTGAGAGDKYWGRIQQNLTEAGYTGSGGYGSGGLFTGPDGKQYFIVDAAAQQRAQAMGIPVQTINGQTVVDPAYPGVTGGIGSNTLFAEQPQTGFWGDLASVAPAILAPLAFTGAGLAGLLGPAAAGGEAALGGAGVAGTAGTLPESYWSATAGLAPTSDAAAAGAGVYSLGSGAGTGLGGSAMLGSGASAGAGTIGGLSLGTIASLGTGAVGLATLLGGGKTTTNTSTTSIPPLSPQEAQLIQLNEELAQKQLANLDSLQPFQQGLIADAVNASKATSAYTDAYNKLVTPEQQAQAAADDFARAQKLGPIQDELLQAQLDQIRRNGAATPEQLALIKEATDAGIAAGTGDIDTQTKRGIGLISDELANSRGLRMTDTPILREATLLTRSGEDQKASLIKNLRAGEVTAKLNYPLAVSQLESGINLGQQNLATATKQFQDQLRQQAFQNRLNLTGQATTAGIGMASIGAGNGGLSALTQARIAGAPQTSSSNVSGLNLGEVGSLASGVGAVGRLF